MKSTRFGLILASVGLPLMLSVATLVRADDQATSEAEAAAAAPASAATVDTNAGNSVPAADAAKPGAAKARRLRFRSATSSGCTSATGGVSEADIHRAEEGRAKN